ncbi:cell division protein ZapD [Ferrimonas lipolytica]|uniref:Cell division protein ZapD n=1 Tax=Ferrimonas lipolytica TaxID=2724191 RepID=A0A6H1UHF6_9GAMM|nr:cell division protein ZapD [Ferrimonas lipolytica]QIZ78545.1 cell division protein ZapD [Ferrimonas lipolytica]
MWLLFEQPLNEKVRSYLRVEAVFNQVNSHQQFQLPHGELAFFHCLFELMELIDRADLRSELLKDIDRQLSNIERWRQYPNVDQQQLDLLANDFKRWQQQLYKLTKPTSELKADRFLAAVRQRLTIPGGCGSFDLPQLHFWLARPLEWRQQQAQQWLALLTPFTASIEQLLAILRGSSQWQDSIAMAGSYQAASEKTIDLLRLRIKQEHGVYPAISAHRNRFTIHLVNNDTGKADHRNLPLQLCLSMEQQ